MSPWLAQGWFRRVGAESNYSVEADAWRLYQRFRRAVTNSCLRSTPLGRVAESTGAAVDTDARVREVMADIEQFNQARAARGESRRIEAGLAWLPVVGTTPPGTTSLPAIVQISEGSRGRRRT